MLHKHVFVTPQPNPIWCDTFFFNKQNYSLKWFQIKATPQYIKKKITMAKFASFLLGEFLFIVSHIFFISHNLKVLPAPSNWKIVNANAY